MTKGKYKRHTFYIERSVLDDIKGLLDGRNLSWVIREGMRIMAEKLRDHKGKNSN